MRYYTFLLISLIVAGASAEEYHPGITNSVPQVEQNISIDGVISDAEWAGAFRAPLDYERKPSINIRPLERTIVLMAHSNDTLYIAFKCYDSDPGRICAQVSDREQIVDDDHVLIMLDTFNDDRTSLCFAANPHGIQMDGLAANDDFDWSWDAIWECEGAIHDWGWSLEMAIPFDQIRMQRKEGKQTWGFDAWRIHPRDVVHFYSVTQINPDNNCLQCEMVEIEGFDGVEQGNNIELNPTFTYVNTSARELPGGEYRSVNDKADAGLTGKWGITPNITATATINPDFSQIEADSRQLDINRNFALYFPEKRPFFLEGSDFFSSRLIQSYYSRSFRNPNYGVKVGGKEGNHSFGLMMIEDEITNLIIPGSQFSRSSTLAGSSKALVGRYNYDVTGRHTIGAMFTHRTGESDYQNSTFGVDGLFRLTDTDEISFQYLGSSTQYSQDTASAFTQSGDRFSGSALEANYSHREKDWYGYLRYTNYGDTFRADVGFVPQVDYVHYLALAGYIWTPEEETWYSRLNLEVMYQYQETQAGEQLDQRADLFGLYTGPMQSVLAARYFLSQRTYLGNSFDVTYFGTYSSIAPSRYVTLELDTSFGDTIDYRNNRLAGRLRLQPMLTLKPSTNLYIYLEHHFERTSVDEQEIYTANISQAAVRYLFNRRTMLRATLQYVDYHYNQEMYISAIDEEFQQLFTQLLFSYKLNPRTVLFLGYSDNYQGGDYYDLARKDYTFFAKIGYAWQM